ncbi:formin-like protein 20 [Zalophus californianus]|uniref:Formin-like protein 20 n=1 Tax=Zalophus californianus TaxID=9704 RepID=A0A6P9F5S1_ZALCA|nr:formin-like protein 20 [Zalophus californianus]
MAVLLHGHQRALPPRPLPPPFAKEKRPSPGHRAPTWRLPRPRPPPAALLSWGSTLPLLGLRASAEPRPLSLHGACPKARARLSEAQRRSPRLPAVAIIRSGPPSLPPRLCRTPQETHWSARGPRAPTPTPSQSVPDPPSGLPPEASVTLRPPAGHTQRAAAAAAPGHGPGGRQRGPPPTARGQRGPEHRALRPWPLLAAAPPLPPQTAFRRGPWPARVSAEGRRPPKQGRRHGPVPGPGCVSGQLPRDGAGQGRGRPGTGQPHVCPCSPGPGPFPAERDRAIASTAALLSPRSARILGWTPHGPFQLRPDNPSTVPGA